MYGTVARLSPERGSGFVQSIDGREIFFHRNALQGVDFEALTLGARVEFEIGHEPGDEVGEAPRATRIRLDDAAIDPAAGGATSPLEDVGG